METSKANPIPRLFKAKPSEKAAEKAAIKVNKIRVELTILKFTNFAQYFLVRRLLNEYGDYFHFDFYSHPSDGDRVRAENKRGLLNLLDHYSSKEILSYLEDCIIPEAKQKFEKNRQILFFTKLGVLISWPVSWLVWYLAQYPFLFVFSFAISFVVFMTCIGMEDYGGEASGPRLSPHFYRVCLDLREIGFNPIKIFKNALDDAKKIQQE